MRTEFLGVSGVGKTTIAKRYVSDQISKGNIVKWPWNEIYKDNKWFVRNIRKGLLVIKECLLHPIWSKKIYSVLAQLNLSKRDLSTLLFNGIFLKHSIQKCKSDICYVYDEGVFQYIYAICLRINNVPCEEVLYQIITMFDLPDDLIVVQASAEKIFDRLNERSRLTRIMETDDLYHTINDMIDIEDRIIDFITKHGLFLSERIEYIDNN